MFDLSTSDFVKLTRGKPKWIIWRIKELLKYIFGGYQMTKEEKFEKALEWLENASYNCNNAMKIGIGLVPIIKSQIDNSIKALKDEDIKDIF